MRAPTSPAPLALLAAALFTVFSLPTGCTVNRDTESDPTTGKPVQVEPTNPGETLIITPSDAVVTTDGKNPAPIKYAVLRLSPDRTRQDVTDRVTLTIDADWLGTFQGSVLTLKATASGKTTVRAHLPVEGGEEETGSTSLTARLSTIVIAPGTPTDAPGRFNGPADSSRAPDIAYPPPNVLIPPNLNELEIHWVPKAATLFEIDLVSEAFEFRVFTTCTPVGTGCVFLPDEKTWKALAEAAKGKTMQLSIKGTTEGAGVGVSAEQPLSFSDQDMKGGLYYWAASTGGIVRYDFGLRGQKAESYYNPLNGPATCIGCHALSRNGKRIAVGMNIPKPATLRGLETGTKTKLFEMGSLMTPGDGGGSNYQAYSPDGQWLVSTQRGGLTLHDGATGMLIGDRGAVRNANMPDFSPDGKEIVFSRSSMDPCLFGILCINLSVTGGSLYAVPFNGMAGFGAERLILQSDGSNNYYPSYSPDGRFIAFNRAGGDSYDAMDARVMVIPASGGNAIDLTSVNTSVGNSWPKWGPFIHRFGGNQIMWLTFSSRRPFGVRPTPAAQIWMAAVSVKQLEGGKDSGFQAFRLPFQALGTGNHIPQWVEKVDRPPCGGVEAPGCGPNEQCVDGYCTPVIQ